MAKRTINKDIINSINKFIEKIKKQYNVTAIILFGSYAKGTENENSDIDIAVISDDFDDIYDCMAILMGMTWDIDASKKGTPKLLISISNLGVSLLFEISNECSVPFVREQLSKFYNCSNFCEFSF